MKNFSLKALGAFIFAAGLVVAGVAAPAFAANSTAAIVTNPANTAFSPSSDTPAFTATMTGATISSSLVYMSVGATNGSMVSWGTKATCPAFGSASVGNESSCGITSITVNSVETIGEWKVYTGGISATGMRLWHGGGSAFSTATGNVEITFASGAFVTSAANSIYTFKLGTETSSGSTIDLASASVTVGTPSETVTFNANGGSGTMSNQTSGSAANLTPNAFTKSGYTFGGWASTQQNAIAGTVFLANGANYNFQSSRTLYAIWTPGGGGGSSATANLTLNASTGQLVAGSTVAVAASGLQATAPYTVVVQSTPQTIGSGNASAGAVNTSVTLPAGLEAGWHTLTFSSTAADGSAVTSVTYFKVSASGTLLATSSTIPAELANTGINSATGISLLAGGLSLALVGAEMFMIARRKRSN